jgi:hypothetical protein
MAVENLALIMEAFINVHPCSLAIKIGARTCLDRNTPSRIARMRHVRVSGNDGTRWHRTNRGEREECRLPLAGLFSPAGVATRRRPTTSGLWLSVASPNTTCLGRTGSGLHQLCRRVCLRAVAGKASKLE